MVFTCASCNKVALKTGPTQKYCPGCSVRRDLQRKKKWQENNPEYAWKGRKKWNEKRRVIADSIGVEISKAEKWPMAWMADGCSGATTDLVTLLRISIPFTTSLLKNHCWSLARQGHIFLRAETRQWQEKIIAVIRNSGVKFKHNKVWLDLCVQKPDHKSGDAINFVDRIADAVKKAIEIDDRWFCIRRLDWQIVKHEPMIFVGVGQPECEDSQVCSICGRILPLTCFSRSRSNKLGVGRDCKECSRPMDKLRRDARRVA